jgi:phospholipase C
MAMNASGRGALLGSATTAKARCDRSAGEVPVALEYVLAVSGDLGCFRFLFASTLVAVLASAGCAQRAALIPSAVPGLADTSSIDAVMPRASSKIKHVVVIMQENRSFDNLFHRFPGADTVDAGRASNGKRYRLVPWTLTNPTDINHAHLQFILDYDRGRNDGFDRELETFSKTCKYVDPRNHPDCWILKFETTPYAYVPRREIGPYWTMAMRYAIGDRTFESNNGPSYPSHEYMIAGQSAHVAEVPALPPHAPSYPEPWGCDAEPFEFTWLLLYGKPNSAFGPKAGTEAAGPFPCFFYPTIARTLDAAGVSWAYYAPAIGANSGDVWSAFDAIWPVRFGADWAADVKSPETSILNDIASSSLRSVSWVVPSFLNSDHAGSRSATGPMWVASIVNAIGKSRYWNDCAIVVMWDDWGGWYDHVVPPQYPDPRTGAYEGLGFRVPVLVISPYAKRHYVSHRQHEIASTLHLIETVFGLPSLRLADARADAFDDMFDFTQKPTKFVPIPSAMNAADFLRQRPSYQAPDY